VEESEHDITSRMVDLSYKQGQRYLTNEEHAADQEKATNRYQYLADSHPEDAQSK